MGLKGKLCCTKQGSDGKRQVMSDSPPTRPGPLAASHDHVDPAHLECRPGHQTAEVGEGCQSEGCQVQCVSR